MSGPAWCRRRPAQLPRPHLLWPAGGVAGLLAVLTVVAPAAFAATAPACGVAVLARSDSAGRTELLVAAPDLRSQIDLPASAFSVSSAGATVPLACRVHGTSPPGTVPSGRAWMVSGRAPVGSAAAPPPAGGPGYSAMRASMMSHVSVRVV